MDEVDTQSGIEVALDALFAGRLTLLCGAGLSMAAPSLLPSAAVLAQKAKTQYDATYGGARPPLPESIDDQAQFFFQRNELATVYLSTYIDHDAFASQPNDGHFAAADLLLAGAISTAVSTNVDTLIEVAGNILYGQIGVGVERDQVATLPQSKSPLLKIHGCWSDPPGTIWARGQIGVEPFHTRITESSAWLSQQLLDRDLVIVGYCTDWDYLNDVLERSITAVTPGHVVVVDTCDSAEFEEKAPALSQLGQRAGKTFCHVRCSGDTFLNQLRIEFSRAFLRRTLHNGRQAYEDQVGTAPNRAWLEPGSTDPDALWRIRRDLEGAGPNVPSTSLSPPDEPLLGMSMLQLQAAGATAEGCYWNLNGNLVRVLRTSNRLLHEVQAAFSRETSPVVAPDYVIAVGAESVELPSSVVRGSGTGTITRGPAGKWLSRIDSVTELQL